MRRGFMYMLTPSQWVMIGVIIVLIGLVGTGRLLVFFKGPFEGMDPLKTLYDQYTFTYLGDFPVNLGDLIELLGLLVMFFGVKQY